MKPLFVSSCIGTDHATQPDDVTREALGCATTAELNACRFVTTDGYALVTKDGLKLGLAHVRLAEQVPGLAKLQAHVGTSVDVYLVGGFAPQSGPADAILKHFSLGFGYGTAIGVNEIYEHVKKPNLFTAGKTDGTGHVPGFVALVGDSKYEIGTHSLFGCVGVLVVPKGTKVVMRKIHIHDATTLPGIGSFNSKELKEQQVV